jgi:hypothetical protein
LEEKTWKRDKMLKANKEGRIIRGKWKATGLNIYKSEEIESRKDSVSLQGRKM